MLPPAELIMPLNMLALFSMKIRVKGFTRMGLPAAAIEFRRERSLSPKVAAMTLVW
jgi:hypothetical protein